MTSEQVTEALLNITYTDDTDIIELRWLLLHGLNCYADCYKSAGPHQSSLNLLQQYKKLQQAHDSIKQKARGNSATHADFIFARTEALRTMQYLTTAENLVAAA